MDAAPPENTPQKAVVGAAEIVAAQATGAARSTPADSRVADSSNGRRRQVLFVSADPVGASMAGVGIRYFELARVLAAHADVTIAHSGARDETLEGIPTVAYRPHAPRRLREPLARADVVIAQPQWPLINRWLRRTRARIVFDIYDPETFETLELMATERPLIRRAYTDLTLDRLHDALRTGHHFMCASEKQRDLWLGAMLGQRLIDPRGYDLDPTLRSVIDTVPFGLSDQAPSPPAIGAGPRGRLDGVDGDSELVLWNGGLWNWLDPVTAVRAVALLAERRPRLRLVFMGAARQSAAAAATDAARAAARELGVHGSVVHFNETWVPYDERAAWLMQADCAISTHAEHLETRFAFRTRLLDCFWAGLPVVCTAGDDLADRVARDELGVVAPPGDIGAVASALEQVLDRGRGSYADALARVALDYRWPQVARALVAWATLQTPPVRLGDTRGVTGMTPAQRMRSAAYLAGGRLVLERRYPRS
jgi:glycosyltransferase involved in cell wall biosynthesis